MTKRTNRIVQLLTDTEPLGDSTFISYSYLKRLQSKFLHPAAFSLDPRYLEFGSEVHKRILEPHRDHTDQADWEGMLENMVLAANADDFLGSALNDDRAEFELLVMRGNLGGYLDIKIDGVGIDLKTTSAGTHKGFLRAMDSFDYYMQAWVYRHIAELDQMIFSGLSKKPPYRIFHVDALADIEKMNQAEEMIELLLTINKDYEQNSNPKNLPIR